MDEETKNKITILYNKWLDDLGCPKDFDEDEKVKFIDEKFKVFLTQKFKVKKEE